ncbi:MAG: hypothetical protein ABI402_03560 [Ferruginibacter sp.]
MTTNFTKTIATSFICFFLISFAFAGVVIPANQSVVVSADNASNAISPAFTQLDNIVIAEMKATDFAATAGASKSLVLTAPSGWTFKPGCGSIEVVNAKDFSAVSMNISWTTITINFTVKGTTNIDVLNIAGVQVQATNGANVDCQGMIYRSSSNPGTASINGITSGTSFFTLSQTSGMATRLAFTTRPVASAAGTIFEQQPVIVTQDQFGNPTAKGLQATQNVKIKLSSGTGALIGTTVINIGTLGGNGIAIYTDLQLNTCGIKKLIATSGSLTFAVTSEIIIKEEETNARISSGDADDYYPDWMATNSFNVIPAI